MIYSLVFLAILGGASAFGLLVSWWMIRQGEPGNGRAPGSTPSWAVFRARLPLMGFNLAMMAAGGTIASFVFADHLTFAWPGTLAVAAQVFLVFALEDASFYVWHRILHQHKGLYRRIHRIHHQAWAPLPLEYIYVHPVEWMVPAIAPAVTLVGLTLAQGQLSVWVFWIYLLVRQLHELNIHATSRRAVHLPLPLLGTPEDHALHHAKPTQGGYASIFQIWDRAFGTRIPAQKLR
ncbi:MAG: sterol desaturase family protein [Pseudomonadota bacterium]|nr:sterol desaturase family protein [Pseudomonadota bacterium]